jgi:geranylgeranyl pyrophosphate synthase
VEAVKAMVKAAGGIEKARSIANNFAAKAVEDIKLLPDNEHKRIMLAILDESVKRRY